MEPIILSRDPLFFTGDFDIRVDDHNHMTACHFFDLLELILLNRRASESTHELGHVLDLIIIRGVQITLSVVNVCLTSCFRII